MMLYSEAQRYLSRPSGIRSARTADNKRTCLPAGRRDDQYMPVPAIRDSYASIAENPISPAVLLYSEFKRFATSMATFLNVDLTKSIL